MAPAYHDQLGPRERQIMEIIYRRGSATAEEVRSDLKDPLSNAAVRGMLRLLEEKQLLRHEQDGPRYVYHPTADASTVSRNAMRDLMRTFYNNSAGSAIVAMLGAFESRVSQADLDQLEQMIADARKRAGRKA